MDTIQLILTVAGIHLLLVVTPGANFLVVSQHALHYSRQVALVTAVGVGTATIIQITLGFLGVAAIMTQSLWLLNMLKLLGALYLIYLGGKVFWKAHKPLQMASQQSNNALARDDAYRIGLLTCLSNPKSTIYYLALFTPNGKSHISVSYVGQQETATTSPHPPPPSPNMYEGEDPHQIPPRTCWETRSG